MTCPAYVCCVGLALSGFAASARAELRAGAATENITPNIGIAINGGTGPILSRHVHDELHARALVLEEGQTRLAFVIADCCLLDRPVFDEAKELIRQQTGLPPEQVLMSCTHTHSAGAACGVHLTEEDPAYRRWLPARFADSVRRAIHNLAPAQIAWGRGSLPQHVFCRRLRLKPGVTYTNQLGQTHDLAKMNWDSPHPADGEPAGPTDPEVFVLSLQHTNGLPLALLANYSLHYVGDVGPGDLSADYFGVFCDRIEQLLHAERQDPPFVALLANGTSGDINNINPKTGGKSSAPYTQIRRVADDLAAEVHRVVKTLSYQRTVTLKARATELPVAVRRPTPEEARQARDLVQGRSARELKPWTEMYAREHIILADYPATLSLPLQVLRLGEVAIAAWPGEIFAATGLELKQHSPIKPIFNIGLANGWYGYIPPPEQHRLGAYETWRGRTSPLEENATAKLTAAFLKLLEETQ